MSLIKMCCYRYGTTPLNPIILFSVSESQSLQALAAILAELGVPACLGDLESCGPGYPVVLTTNTGDHITLPLPEPPILAALDSEHIGLTLVDSAGFIQSVWGLAKNAGFWTDGGNIFDTDLALLVESGFRGTPGSVFLDGYRYYVSSFDPSNGGFLAILVIDAHEELEAREDATRFSRSASMLRRIGTALTMHQNLQPLCIAAVHEIASSAELAAVLLWISEPETPKLNLVASVGASRQGTTVVEELRIDGTPSCIAELVGSTRREFHTSAASDHMMTANLEAKYCYLKPGGVMVLPLLIGDRLLGVLELIARENDDRLVEDRELFAAVGEHLALALNSAMMFESFEKLATRDSLTGIANHRAMQDFLHRRVAESARTNSQLGVIMLDIDHFRAFNEEEGHDVGDLAIKKVAEAILACVRPYDLAGRYGGEEFAIILPGSGLETTMIVAERIRKRIEQIAIIGSSGIIRQITASLGCAEFPETARDANSLLKAADQAMYRAKRDGRNKSMAFEGEFKAVEMPVALDLDLLDRWLTPTEKRESDRLRDLCAPYISHLAQNIPLSSSQELILTGLIKVIGPYRKIKEDHDAARAKTLEAASEFRILMPALSTFKERFDGLGPLELEGTRIPLLTRVLHVVLAQAEQNGESFARDPGAFDPTLVDLLMDARDAA
ncbi:MAG: GGDEF domain-containing protein [Armatimonadetes bacterium]|nr:GGDEF domain-containing protein [Armatimonadota bacterium]